MRKNTAVVFDWLKVLQEIQTYQRRPQKPNSFNFVRSITELKQT